MSQNTPKVDSNKLELVVKKLEELGYTYIEGFVSNKKDKVRAVHKACGKIRYTKFSLYDQKSCKTCKMQESGQALSLEARQRILDLHEQGFSTKEIADEIKATTNTVLNHLRRNGIDTSKKPKDLTSVCVVCQKEFQAKYSNRNKVCSKECSIKHTSQARQKYTESDIKKVIHLKKLGQTNDDIAEITGVNKNKIKEIVQQNDLYIGSVQAQRNAYEKKLI
jgi:transcriptional regulator